MSHGIGNLKVPLLLSRKGFHKYFLKPHIISVFCFLCLHARSHPPPKHSTLGPTSSKFPLFLLKFPPKGFIFCQWIVFAVQPKVNVTFLGAFIETWNFKWGWRRKQPPPFVSNEDWCTGSAPLLTCAYPTFGCVFRGLALQTMAS